ERPVVDLAPRMGSVSVPEGRVALQAGTQDTVGARDGRRRPDVTIREVGTGTLGNIVGREGPGVDKAVLQARRVCVHQDAGLEPVRPGLPVSTICFVAAAAAAGTAGSRAVAICGINVVFVLRPEHYN